MPRGDGTGPWGAGPLTGRGLGYCPMWTSGWGRRFGRAPAPRTREEEQSVLQEQLEAIQVSLAEISKALGERGK